jgi:hypothetical protein
MSKDADSFYPTNKYYTFDYKNFTKSSLKERETCEQKDGLKELCVACKVIMNSFLDSGGKCTTVAALKISDVPDDFLYSSNLFKMIPGVLLVILFYVLIG